MPNEIPSLGGRYERNKETGELKRTDPGTVPNSDVQTRIKAVKELIAEYQARGEEPAEIEIWQEHLAKLEKTGKVGVGNSSNTVPVPTAKTADDEESA